MQEKVESSEAMAQPVLDELPDNSLALTPIVAQPFHVGDVRLAELRKLMQAAGFSAEFRGEGTLLINGTVAVRKGGTGRLEVEAIMDLPALGGPDPTFYDVRRKVYEGLAVVTASA
jgi:cleavage and polyadenylation specificity factor subunit 2